MKCPNCSNQNPQGARFCNQCGSGLHVEVEPPFAPPSLEEKLERIQRYLPQGLAEKILTQRDKIEGELRQVTIMFCDMEGFTPLSAKLGPEEIFTLMDQLYEILIHKVNEYEGTVNELRGDGILALFGAPIALEEAPARALQSALAIQAEMRKFNETIRHRMEIPPVLFRIGINSGPVVVGSVGNDLRVQFTALGDTINMAARMEGLAKPGTIYVTDETYRLTHPLFQFEPLGEMRIKGKPKPVPVYRLLSAKEDIHRPRLGSERMIYSEMVGRDRELDRLEFQVAKAVNGEGSIVNIIGEAGIGKSRLVAELKQRDVMEGVTFLEGRATSIGRNLSFHPVIDLLRHWAGIRHDDGEATALGKLEKTVRTYCPQKLYEILPFVATLMGIKLTDTYAERIRGIEGEALEKLILKGIRDLLGSASQFAPLVIVTEDLHWSDKSSIELLEALFRLAETNRILFVNVFRPGYSETGERIAQTVRSKFPGCFVEMVLEPLNEKLSESLIGNMLSTGEIHRPFIGNIIQRAGGNPFFIEEVVRSFIDEQAVILKDGRFQVTEKIDTIAIPNTIQDVLMARIDRLEEKTRSLVKHASVIGRNFFYRILVDVASFIDAIDSRLSYLKEVQLIRERTRMDELEYLFKHALSQEAAYKSILPAKRKELHLEVARSIEKVFSEKLQEFYGMLASHYSLAESLEKAEEYLIKAGEEALKSSASNEALHYYQEALALYLKKYGETADPERIAMLEKNIAFALYNRGQYVEAVNYFDKSIKFYRGQLPTGAIPLAFGLLSSLFHFALALYIPSIKFKKIPTDEDFAIIDILYKKCRALAIINPLKFFIESLFLCKKIILFDLTKFKQGLEIFVGASTLFSFTGFSSFFYKLSNKILLFYEQKFSSPDTKQSIVYELSKTVYRYFSGNWSQIIEYDDMLINQNLSIGEINYVSHNLFWHGLPLLYEGLLNEVKRIVDKLEDIYQTYENDVTLLLRQLLSSSLHMEAGELDDALNETETGIDFGRKTYQGLSLVHMFSCRARIQLLMGVVEEAEKSLADADNVRRELNPVPWQLSNFLKSKVIYDLYLLEQSINNSDSSSNYDVQRNPKKSCKLLLRQSQKVPQHRTEAYRFMGVYCWLVGRQRRALGWWNRSMKEGERLGARLELSRTCFEVGKRLLEEGSRHKKLNGTNPIEYLDRARALFEEMNLKHDLNEWYRVAGRNGRRVLNP